MWLKLWKVTQGSPTASRVGLSVCRQMLDGRRGVRCDERVYTKVRVDVKGFNAPDPDFRLGGC